MADIIVSFVEDGAPMRVAADLELEGICLGTDSSPFMHSGSQGHDYQSFYHSDGVSVMVQQTSIESSIIKSVNPGWRPRRFNIAGDSDKVRGYVERLGKVTKLKEEAV